MNAISNLESGMKQASERAIRIQAFRAEIFNPRHRRLNIVAIRTVVENGRIVTKFLVDSSLELGRGSRYWLPSIAGARS